MTSRNARAVGPDLTADRDFSSFGGGAYIWMGSNASVTLDRSTFYGNRVDGWNAYGAQLFVENAPGSTGSSLVVSSCRFTKSQLNVTGGTGMASGVARRNRIRDDYPHPAPGDVQVVLWARAGTIRFADSEIVNAPVGGSRPTPRAVRTSC